MASFPRHRQCPHCAARFAEECHGERSAAIGLITAEEVHCFYLWRLGRTGEIEPSKIDEETADGVYAVLCGGCNREVDLPPNPASDAFIAALSK
jgi:hypothetical protein